jgi:hypothetical protein
METGIMTLSQNIDLHAELAKSKTNEITDKMVIKSATYRSGII